MQFRSILVYALSSFAVLPVQAQTSATCINLNHEALALAAKRPVRGSRAHAVRGECP
jgi:hypothetical protein